MNNQAGKGDKPRPITDRNKYESNWEKAFGKKKDVPNVEEMDVVITKTIKDELVLFKNNVTGKTYIKKISKKSKVKENPYSFIENFKTQNKFGFNSKEIEEVLKHYPNINMEKYENALRGNTCMMDEEHGLIIYHCDLIKAIQCGIENRELHYHEWD